MKKGPVSLVDMHEALGLMTRETKPDDPELWDELGDMDTNKLVWRPRHLSRIAYGVRFWGEDPPNWQ